jgi:hypothetical protein
MLRVEGDTHPAILVAEAIGIGTHRIVRQEPTSRQRSVATPMMTAATKGPRIIQIKPVARCRRHPSA